MKIDGVEYENPNYGYVTEVHFPFTYCETGEGSVDIFDAGFDYDKHLCKCTMVFHDSDEYKAFIQGYTRRQPFGGRSALLTFTECDSSGFHPFGYFVTEPEDGYIVMMSNVKTEDKQDVTGKYWKVSFSLAWINEQERTFRPLSIVKPDGSLTFAGVSGLPYPAEGFKKDKSFEQKLDLMAGGFQYGLDINNTDDDRIDTEFSLELTDAQVNNLMQSIIQNYRGNNTPLSCPDIYSVFGLERSNFGNTRNVKLIDKVVKIKHISLNRHEATFKIVQAV
jgi:hypothetical protein